MHKQNDQPDGNKKKVYENLSTVNLQWCTYNTGIIGRIQSILKGFAEKDLLNNKGTRFLNSDKISTDTSYTEYGLYTTV